MITTSQVVEKIIKESPYLEEGLRKGILNLSALARSLKPRIEEELMKPIQKGAIVMSLKRYSFRSTSQFKTPDIFTTAPDMFVRSNLIEITVQNSDTLIQKHAKLLESVGTDRTSFITMTQGMFETTIILSKSYQDIVLEQLKGESVIATIPYLSSITIRLPVESITTPGVHYYILKSLAWENINIVEVVSTYLEFTIILEDKDVDKAFSTLKNLFK